VTSSAPGETRTRAERFVAGDPLRALAALMIVVVHAWIQIAFFRRGEPALFGSAGDNLLVAFAWGVSVFFVLSGYLIARPFVRAIVEGEPLPRVRNYLVNRALRILPAYWVVLTAMLLIYDAHGSSAQGVVATYLFGQELFYVPARGLLLQTWSLSVEAGFYLAVPLAALALVRATRGLDRRGRLAAVGVTLAGVALASLAVRRWIPDSIGPFEKLFLSLPALLFAFVPGIALAALELGGARERARVARSAGIPLALAVLALACFAGLVATGGNPATDRGLSVSLLAAGGAGFLVAAPLVLQWSGLPAWRALDNAPLHWIGKRSYSLFLIHLPVLNALLPRVLDVASGRAAFALLLAAGLALSMLLAHVSYELVEKPFLRRRRAWRRPQPARQTATTSSASASDSWASEKSPGTIAPARGSASERSRRSLQS
jgi:peptidoglycan/LPS O-acetylase OafA/YrhL